MHQCINVYFPVRTLSQPYKLQTLITQLFSLFRPLYPVCPLPVRLQQQWSPAGGARTGGISRCEDHLQLPVGSGGPGDTVESRRCRAAAHTQRRPVQTAGPSASFRVCFKSGSRFSHVPKLLLQRLWFSDEAHVLKQEVKSISKILLAPSW